MTILFLVNPAAGNGGPVERLPAIEAGCRRRGIAYRIRRTGSAGSAGRLVSGCGATIPGLDRVAAVGGDGAVTETAAGLIGTGLPLGVVPLGTGNDFAGGIGLPSGRDLDACLDVVFNGVPRAIDIARYRTDSADGVYLNVASTGFDAAVTQKALRLKRRINGRFVYLMAILAALPRLGFHRIEMDVDGVRIRRRALMVAVANGRRYGGGIRINPGGAVDDGRLDLIVYRAASPVKMVATLPRFILGRHRRLDYLETRRCRSVRIDAETPLPVNVDGEMKGATPLEVEIVPKGLTILTPPGRRQPGSAPPHD